MTIKKEVKEIKEMIKKLISETVKQLTIDDIEVGEQFIYCGHKYTKLNENNYCIIDDFNSSFMYCIFDPISNNYSESIIRQYINSDRFINKLGVNVEDLEEYMEEDVDLYNYVKITLLSIKEYKRYKHLIKNYNTWFWLRSAHSGDTNKSCCINRHSYWYKDNVRDCNNAARVALILKSETKVNRNENEG